MVDLHVVDDGQVELVQDHRLGDMGGELGMAMHHGHGAGAPALVSGDEFGRAAQREGGHDVHGEGGGVVVEHDDAHIRLHFGDPLLGFLVAREHPLPIGLLRLAVVQRRADGGNVGGGDPCDDLGHYFFHSDLVRAPLGERPPASIMSAYSCWVHPVILAANCWKERPSVAPSLEVK